MVQLLVEALLGILNFDGLNLKPGLHLEKALIHNGFVLVTNHFGLIEEAYLEGISDERATLLVSTLLAQLLLHHLLESHVKLLTLLCPVNLELSIVLTCLFLQFLVKVIHLFGKCRNKWAARGLLRVL